MNQHRSMDEAMAVNPMHKEIGELPSPPSSPPSYQLELDHAIGYTSSANNGIIMHPDSAHFIVASGACIVINDLNDPHCQSFLNGHSQTITCMDISPSGNMIASGQEGVESDVIIWDYQTQSIKFRLEEHQFGIAVVRFSWDGKFLVTVGSSINGKLIIWDCTSGYIVGSSAAAPFPFNQIAWGGRVKDIKRRPTLDCQFATCSKDESYIELWTLTPSTGQLHHDKLRTGSFKRTYQSIQYSGDGEYLIGGSATGDITVFLVRNKGICCTFPVCSGGVLSLLITSSYDIISGGGDSSITKYQFVNPKEFIAKSRVHCSGPIASISSGCDDCEGMVGTLTGDTYRIQISDPSHNFLVSQSHSGSVNAVGFPVAISDRFASCSTDSTIKVWDVSDYSLICSARADSHIPSCLVISDECIISGWSDGRIRSFEAGTADPLWYIDHAHSGGISALSLSRNEKFLVSGGCEGDVRVWDIRNKELLSHLKEHTSYVPNVAIYGDNRRAISCSRDRSILCWDLQAELRVSCHRQNMGGINDIGLTRDEMLVISVGQEKRVTFWDLRSPQAVNIIELNSEGNSIDVNPSGNLFAVGDSHSYAKLFDIRAMKLLSVGVGHSRSVTCVKFSPDGKQLISSGEGGNVFIWNVFQL